MELTANIDCILANPEKEHLVNFNTIAHLTGEAKNGIPSLLRSGEVADVRNNLIEMYNGDEKQVVLKQGTTYFVDRRLALAFLKKRCPYMKVAVTEWEARFGRADIPQTLFLNAPPIMQHFLQVFNGGDRFRSVFRQGRWYFCLNDVVRAATGDASNFAAVKDHICRTDPTLQELFSMRYKFG